MPLSPLLLLPAKMVPEYSGGSCHLQLLLEKLNPLRFSVQIQKESFKTCVFTYVYVYAYT